MKQNIFFLLRDSFDCGENELKKLLNENDQLSKILAASVISLKKKKPASEIVK
jgi:hypothetical protein